VYIQSFTVGPFAENTYLLAEANRAILIDPGFSTKEEFEQVTAAVASRELALQAVVLTHAHVDHILGISLVRESFDAPIYLSDKDYYLWENFASQSRMFGFQRKPFNFVPEILPISEEWKVGGFTFDVRYTPGHAPDHISLYSREDGLVIAGDALFKEGIGRTDLYHGDMNTLQRSIREQLYSLPDETTVYPGHGPETTIGHEKKANPFIKAWKKTAFLFVRFIYVIKYNW